MKKCAMFLAMVALAAVTVGCDQVTIKSGPDPDMQVQETYSGQPIDYLPSTSLDGGEQDAESGSAVASAMELQEKYAKAMEKMLQMQREVLAMEKSNQQLQKQISDAEKARQQDQQELKEANEKLFEMRKELETWKKNVLGFQGEMRQALVAIMKSQERVLKLLGAEQVTARGQ